MLTAAAAILGMIPIASDSFWRPMVIAIMGGLAVATMLTLLFLPAAYAAWFRIREPVGESGRDKTAVIDEGGWHGSSLSTGHAQGA